MCYVIMMEMKRIGVCEENKTSIAMFNKELLEIFNIHLHG